MQWITMREMTPSWGRSSKFGDESGDALSSQPALIFDFCFIPILIEVCHPFGVV